MSSNRPAHAGSNSTPLNLGEDIDAPGREPHLIHCSADPEVRLGDAVLGKWGPELAKRRDHSGCVLRCRADPHIEITRRPHDAIRGQGVGSDDEELDLRGREGVEEVDEVLVEVGLEAHRRTSLPGIAVRG